MSFNAQEILARLRAQSSSAPESIPAPPPVFTSESPSKTVLTSATASASVSKPIISTKVIKAPVALTLTPSQREENLNVRLELEKDIKHLQEELATLKQENRQLRNDKEDVEHQFIEYKIKSEDCITKLRGRIAGISMGLCPVPNHLIVEDRHGGGRLYPVAPPGHGVAAPTIKPHQQSPHVFLKTNSAGSLTPSFSSPAPLPGYLPSPNGGIPYSINESYTQLDAEGFRDPTFSELMRRSTVEKHDFKESLRRTTNKRVPVQQSAHNSASKLPVRNVSGKVFSTHTPVLTGRHHQQQYLHTSYSSPQYQHKNGNSELFHSPSGTENKANTNHLGNNNHNSLNSGESTNLSTNNSSNNAGSGAILNRKASKNALDIINTGIDSVIGGVGVHNNDDDDLEVVEIDLRH